MKILKPTENDINKAFNLLGALSTLADGFIPFDQPDEDDPEWLHEEDKAACLDKVLELYENSSIEWLLAALSAMIDPANKIIDDTADTLEPHPDIKRGIADSKRLDWLITQGAVSFNEAYDDEYCVLTDKIALSKHIYISDAEQLGVGVNCRAAIDDAMSKEAV